MGSQVSSFDFSTLYTSLPHDLIKAKVLSLINWCFNRESKSYLCTSLKAGFLATRNMTRIDVGRRNMTRIDVGLRNMTRIDVGLRNMTRLDVGL